MKKIMTMVAVVCAFATTVFASVDVYTFKSTMYVYSLNRSSYRLTTLNGTVTVDNGSATFELTKKDTREQFTLTLDAGGSSTNGTNTVSSADVLAIIAGKSNNLGAALFTAVSGDDKLALTFAGYGATKIRISGCDPCHTQTSCIKIRTLRGKYVGQYDCSCGNGQYFKYDGSCDIPENREEVFCPVFGDWTATLRTVDGAKYN